MKSRKKWLCLDCGVDTGKIGEHYMLKDEVWNKVMTTSVGMLCIGCIEVRLGKLLIPADFTDSHVNRLKPGECKSQRLMIRLGKA